MSLLVAVVHLCPLLYNILLCDFAVIHLYFILMNVIAVSSWGLM